MQSRKFITIVFSDISNSTRLASQLEPEIYSDLLEAFRERAETISSRHGGEIIRIDGDGLVIIFGHNTPYEDAARRAVETALDLHKLVSSFDPALLPPTASLNLHTGIHGGVVLLKKGDSLTGKYEIIGDATHVSRRLCDFASADEIMVSDDILGVYSPFFKCGPMVNITPRGKTSMIGVWPVRGRAEVTSRLDARYDRTSQTFVGREKFLLQMLKWSGSEIPSQNKGVLISAGAGMGKSRLLTEFLKRATRNGHLAYYASCDAYLGGQALQPIRQWLSDISKSAFGVPSQRNDSARHLDEHFQSEISSILTAFLRGKETPDVSDLLRVFEAVLEKIPNNQNIIFCLDDWQWADQATRDIIISLSSKSDNLAKFIIAGRVVDEHFLELSKAQHMPLPPLSKDHIQEVIQQVLGDSGPFLSEKIMLQSGGSPLYVEEICYALLQNPKMSELSLENKGLAPLTLTRLAQLKPHQIDLLHIAAVMGFIFPQWLFEEITGISTNSPDFDELNSQDFLYEGNTSGTIRFKHALTQDAIYNVIDYRKRKNIHARIAQSWINYAQDIEEVEKNGMIAFHLHHSGQFDQTAVRAMQAGKNAMKLGMLDIAQENFKLFLEAMMKLPDSDNRDKQIYSGLTHYGIASVVDPSEEHLQLIDKVTNVFIGRGYLPGLAAADYWRGFIYYGLGEPYKALENFNSAKSLARQNKNDKLSDSLDNNLAQALAASCQYSTAKTYFKTAKKHERAQIRLGHNPISLAYSLSCEAFMLADQGLFDEADTFYDEAELLITNYADHVSMSVIDHRVASEIWRDEYDQAITYAKRVLSMTTQMKSRYHYVMASALLNVAKWLKSPKDDYIQELIRLTSWMERSNIKQYISLNYGYLSHMSEQNQDWQKCRIYSARAIRRARVGDRLGEAMACRSLTLYFYQSGNLSKANTYFKRAEKSAELRQSKREIKQNQKLQNLISF